jgi:hypothetical protein
MASSASSCDRAHRVHTEHAHIPLKRRDVSLTSDERHAHSSISLAPTLSFSHYRCRDVKYCLDHHPCQRSSYHKSDGRVQSRK